MVKITPDFYKDLSTRRALPFNNDSVLINSGGDNISEQWSILLDKYQFEDKSNLTDQNGQTDFSRTEVQQKETEEKRFDEMNLAVTNHPISQSLQLSNLQAIQSASVLQNSFALGVGGDKNVENTVINVDGLPGGAVNTSVSPDSKLVMKKFLSDVKGEKTVPSDKSEYRRNRLNINAERGVLSAEQRVKGGKNNSDDSYLSKTQIQTVNNSDIPRQRAFSHNVETVIECKTSESNTEGAVKLYPSISNMMNTETTLKVDNALNLEPKIGLPEWNKALGDRIICFVRGGVHQAELKLHPEKLGALQISLRMNNDQIQLHFVSNDHQVRSVIESAIPYLKTSLAESGIQLGNSSVGGQNSSAWHEPGSGKDSSGDGFVENDPHVEDKDIALQMVRTTRGVDMFV